MTTGANKFFSDNTGDQKIAAYPIIDTDFKKFYSCIQINFKVFITSQHIF